VFGDKSPPGKVRPGWDDESIEIDQAKACRVSEYVVQSPTARLPVEVANEDAEPLDSEGPDLVEHVGRVPDPEEPGPTAEEPVQAPHDLLNWH
jgi:hypothetical protein